MSPGMRIYLEKKYLKKKYNRHRLDAKGKGFKWIGAEGKERLNSNASHTPIKALRTSLACTDLMIG